MLIQRGSPNLVKELEKMLSGLENTDYRDQIYFALAIYR
jgi:hypothetical protein